MKTILAIGIISLCAQHTLSAYIANCTSSQQINRIETILNARRAFVAEQYQIANMYEIKYDQKLEKEAMKIKSCDDLKSGANYRIIHWEDTQSYYAFKNFVEKTSNKSFEGYNYEEEHPLQTSIVYCYLNKPCMQKVSEEAKKIAGIADYPLIEVQFFGPKGTISESDFIYGPPGSQCPNGKTDKGLCKIPQIEKQSEEDPINGGDKSTDKQSANQAIVPMYSILMYFSIALMILFV